VGHLLDLVRGVSRRLCFTLSAASLAARPLARGVLGDVGRLVGGLARFSLREAAGAGVVPAASTSCQYSSPTGPRRLGAAPQQVARTGGHGADQDPARVFAPLWDFCRQEWSVPFRRRYPRCSPSPRGCPRRRRRRRVVHRLLDAGKVVVDDLLVRRVDDGLAFSVTSSTLGAANFTDSRKPARASPPHVPVTATAVPWRRETGLGPLGGLVQLRLHPVLRGVHPGARPAGGLVRDECGLVAQGVRLFGDDVESSVACWRTFSRSMSFAWPSRFSLWLMDHMDGHVTAVHHFALVDPLRPMEPSPSVANALRANPAGCAEAGRATRQDPVTDLGP
jgi:hypothetical protein